MTSHSAAPGDIPPARRSNRQRSEATRDRILAAALQTLIEKGYSGASTWEVCRTGDLSKGALLHHFRQRSSMFVELVSELATSSIDSLDAALAGAAPGEKLDRFLDWLWTTVEGDMFAVGLEILTAARTEPGLRAAVRTGGDALKVKLDDVVSDVVTDCSPVDPVSLRTALEGGIHMVRGIGLDLVVGGDRAEHRRNFEAWRELVTKLAR